MKVNQFAVYQVKEGAEYGNIRFRPYDELLENHIKVHVSSYRQVYLSPMSPKETVESIHARFKNRLPKKFPGRSINKSDVYVLNRDGVISAFYVDKEKLIVLPDFMSRSSADVVITSDTSGYCVEGKTGTWVVCEELTVGGRQFYLMQSEQFLQHAAYMILAENGAVVAENSRGFDKESMDMIRDYLNPPAKKDSLQENATVDNKDENSNGADRIRSSELPEDTGGGESIEERILLLPKPRVIGDRVSVLDRLYLKQAEHAIRSGRPEPKIIRDMINERERK
ncbi:MAG: YodL domain-containing protein [Clostridiales bacterium]|nr:YodL domain-containing protein [Clostridiales bacterium]